MYENGIMLQGLLHDIQGTFCCFLLLLELFFMIQNISSEHPGHPDHILRPG